MDDQISRTILDNFDVASVENGQNEINKINAPGVLRGIEGGSLHFITVPNRDQEFIDHSFLNPEYIATHIANGFIIDFMNNQDGSDHQQQPHFIGESISNELEFQHDEQERKFTTFLQLANKQYPNIRTVNETQVIVNNKDLPSITPVNDASKQTSLDHNFLTIDDQQNFPQSLLGDGQLKIYSQPQINVNPPLPPLTPIRRLNSPRKISSVNTPNSSKSDFNSDSISSFKNNQVTPISHTEIKPYRPLAKKSLPHKKRITKKLETIGKNEESVQTVLYTEEPEDTVEDESIVLNTQHFSCQLCGAVCESQLIFFGHLKEHYEPTNILPVKDESGASEEKKDEDSLVTQDLQEVELHFEGFDDDILNQDKSNENEQNEGEKLVHIGNPNEPDAQDTSSMHVHEVEFSDTEDMLEGIRGVVDKVQESVENDTNDGMDIISERTWYTPSALNGDINFKTDITSNNHISQQSVDNFSLFFRHDLDKSENREEGVPLSDAEKKSNQTTPKQKLEKTKRKYVRKAKIRKTDRDSTFSDAEESGDSEDKTKTKKKVQCPKCQKLFNSANALKYHDLSHTGERPHQCEVCGKSFYALSALKVHMRLHSGDKPYECEFCKRAFRQWGDLKYHKISIHTNEKNFQCEFCGKAFARRYSLVVHRRIHTSERNYKCEFCPKTFRASSYLQNHRKVHTGEKPYACKVCGKKFRVSGDLKRHTNIHTRDKRKLKQSNSEESSNRRQDTEEKAQHIISNKHIKAEEVKTLEDSASIKLENSSQSSTAASEAIFYADETLDLFKSEPAFEQSSANELPSEMKLASGISSRVKRKQDSKQDSKENSQNEKIEVIKSPSIRPEESETMSVDLSKILQKGTNLVYFW